MSEEEIGDSVENAALSFRNRHMAHAPSSMVTMADFGQMSRTLSPSLKLAAPSAGTSAWMRMSPLPTLKRVTEPW